MKLIKFLGNDGVEEYLIYGIIINNKIYRTNYDSSLSRVINIASTLNFSFIIPHDLSPKNGQILFLS